MMRNLKVIMAYDGSAYHGFQRQNNSYTVEQAVEETLSRLLGENIQINGCSRTDAGVHAREYVFNFKTQNPIPPEGLLIGANNLLPGDIAFLCCEEVEDSFHARFDCKGKEYEYLVLNNSIKNPFYHQRALLYRYNLDEKLLDSEAKDFVGLHDFKGFCSADCDKEDTRRTIFRFDVRREGDMVVFKVAGNGFLYNMVRIMVGTLLYINEGKIEKGVISRLLKEMDRTKGGVTVPPDGLYLNRVFY